jgi:gliding motility-associated-like protein
MKRFIYTFFSVVFLLTSFSLQAQTCSDGVQNGTETGVDCGGTCPPCSTPCSITLNYSTPTFNPPIVPGPAYTMSSGTISTDGGTFYDPGGPAGSYGNNNLFTQTFCSSVPNGQIQFQFTSWASESCCDFLTIYDGPTASGPTVFSGSSNPGTVTSTSGCLTFFWDTDGSVVAAGWGATIAIVNVQSPLECGGGDIVLTALGQGASVLALDNDFDFGTAGAGWTSNVNASFSNPCDPSIDGGTYMWMGNSAQHPRIIQTVPLDLSCGGDICFWLDFATQGAASPCEGIDLADEGVFLEFSVDGGASWTTMEYFGPAGVGNNTSGGGTNAQMTSWNQYCYTIPAAAETPATIIHWAQTGSSGLNNDHWGIDNVSISSVADCTPYWYDYTYLPPVDDGPIQNTNVTGTATYEVIYTNGTDACSTTVVVPVAPCPCPDVVVSGGGSFCAGDSIPNVVFTVNGGNNPLSLIYAIDGVAQTPVSFSTNTFTLYDPIVGQYTILGITDPSLCVGTFSGNVTVTENPVPVFNSVSGGDTYCTGDVIADITVDATGAGPITVDFTIDGVAQTPVTGTTPISLGNGAGVYVVTSISDGTCSLDISATETIVINAIPVATAGTSTASLCAGESILLTGNITTGTYSWTGPGGFTSTSEDPTINNATVNQSGTYTLIVTDNGCVSPPSTVDITVNQLPVFNSISGGDTYCAGDVVTSINVDAAGAGPITVVFTIDGVAQTSVTGTTPISLGNGAGVYEVTSISDGTCSLDVSATETIVINAIPVATAGTSTASLCAGESILLTGNTTTGTYSWTGPGGFTSTSEDPTINNATVNQSGTYTLIVTENGCVSPPSTVDITVNAVPVVTTDANSTICIGTAVTLNGQGATTYTWSGGITNGVPFTPNSTVTYTVTGTSNGCTSTATVTVTVLPLPIADATTSVDYGYQPLVVTFDNNSLNATSYVWDFGTGQTSSSSASSVTNTFSNVGTFYIVLTASNGICSDTWTDSVVVIPYPAMEIDVPNVFTPNGDGSNDIYFINVVNGTSFEAVILNRWGNVVYSIDTLNAGWDGNVNGKEANEGVYFIKYTAKGLDGQTAEGHTNFHLVR